ncbi:hypothetical protein H0R94_10155 [Treponema socranskii]|uniref:hypothetical protein n=1 Tax=Treponema socranskii TaxID=53419 RepID=UPI003D8E4AFF
MKNKSMIKAESVTAAEKTGSKNGCRAKKNGGVHVFAKLKFAFAAMCVLCFSFPLYARSPYRIKGEVSVGADAAFYEYAGIALAFYNASGRAVRKFFAVVFLSGSDEESPFTEGNCIVLEYDENIAPYAVVNAEFSLDDYISEMPDEAYCIDFLYVSKIEYDDGSVWEDPFGLYAK